MEPLQGQSITSVIKGIVRLTVVRKGPILHVRVVLRSFYFKSLLLFRRTEAGFETRKASSRIIIIIIIFFVKKETFLPSSLQELPLSVLLFWVFAVFIGPLWPSQSPWSVCHLSHTALPQASYPCARVIRAIILQLNTWKKYLHPRKWEGEVLWVSEGVLCIIPTSRSQILQAAPICPLKGPSREARLEAYLYYWSYIPTVP